MQEHATGVIFIANDRITDNILREVSGLVTCEMGERVNPV